MKYSTVLLDANILIAYAIAGDVHNTRAVKLLDTLKDAEWFVHEHVLDEVLSVIHRKHGKKTAIEVGEGLLASQITLLFTDMESLLDAFSSFAENTNLSYTDSVLLDSMESGLFDVLATFDKEFEKLGISVIS